MSRVIRLDDVEATLLVPGGIAVELSLAGKSLDLRARVRERAALLRVGTDADLQVTVDIVERREAEE